MVPMRDETPQFMAVSEVARKLDVTPATIRRWVAEERLEAVKLGRMWRVPRSAVDEMLERATARREAAIESP